MLIKTKKLCTQRIVSFLLIIRIYFS